MINVITPSYNMDAFLAGCLRSVADQDVEHEHFVIDACSTDETAQVVGTVKEFSGQFVSEPDAGMYDAVNKGWVRSAGEIICYLNCDEQYLPGTLDFVVHYFENNSDVDMIFGDVLVVRPSGALISYRKGYPVRWFYIPISLLYVYTCTMFLRRRIFEDGFHFDTSYSSVADADFVMRVQRAGYSIRHIKKYLSVFMFRGDNLSEQVVSTEEKKRLFTAAPTVVQKMRYPLNVLRLLEKCAAGAYLQKKPLKYEMYVGDEQKRRVFCCENPCWKWPKKEPI